jgi:hypothetical protein
MFQTATPTTTYDTENMTTAKSRFFGNNKYFFTGLFEP